MRVFSAVSLFALVCVVSAVPARADTYIGLEGRLEEIAWHDPSTVDFPEDTMGFGIHLGDRVMPEYGAEIGYGTSFGQVVTVNTGASTSTGYESVSNRLTLRQFQFDNFGYLNLGPHGWFQPFLTLGAAYSQANARTRVVTTAAGGSGNSTQSASFVPLFHGQEVDWRAGFGMEMRAGPDLFARFTVRYQPYSFASRLAGGAMLDFSLNAAL